MREGAARVPARERRHRARARRPAALPLAAALARGFLVALACLTAPVAPVAAAPAATPGPGATTLDVYVRADCQHCAEAEAFLDRLAPTRPDLRIVYHPVDRDAAARERLVALSQAEGIWPPGVPTFAVEGRVMTGFDAEQGGPALLALIDGTVPPGDQVETTAFGTLSASRLGLPLFTLALGLVDGIHPCATWMLLCLLALLVRLRDRRRMALVAGTFVLASGAVHFAFMAAWLDVLLIAGVSTPLRRALALVALAIGAFNVKDFLARGRGPTLSIPDAARPGLYARVRAVIDAESPAASLAAVATLAVLVNVAELLCTARLPAMFTAVLAQHELTPVARYAYLGLYIAGHVADDAAMVAIAVAALGSRRLDERGRRWLKLASGAVMLALGAAMLLRPEWLL